jgi:DNA-binding PadR family transcriptional regulator
MRRFSRQTLQVLEVLARASSAGCHGREIARSTGIKSGTLYPILIRLADRGMLNHEWQAPVRAGLPPRHVYRLTASGRAALVHATAAEGDSAKEVCV